MIKISDGKIGMREYASIIFLTIGTKYTDTTPSFLFKAGKNAAWMIPLFSFVIVCACLLLILSLIKKHQVGLVELVNHVTGKYIGGIIILCFFLYMFLGTVINGRSYADIVDTMFYPNTPVPVVLFLLLAASFLIANRGLETIGRTAWFLLPAIGFAAVLLLVLTYDRLFWEHLFPIGGPGLKIILKESLTHTSIFGEVLILASFFSFIRSYKEFRTASLIGITVTCVTMTVYLIFYVVVFDMPSVENLAYLHQQLQRIASVGQVFTHMEAIFLALWLLGSIIHFSIYLYLSAYLLAGVLQLKEFEPLILPLSGFAFFFGLLPENAYQSGSFREFLLTLESSLVVFIPILIWLVDWLKERGSRENS
ncbi:GerAB/ArcD/ProY family transporter [Bacillus niameyensis]|uniref:GerAB/ArcD/ProY family transporter n=1 Tax=Bacillus niameyensis TaxID=1522308 RepID=UPI000784B618|nr:endospore germination permease [Bacillus niameyensis]